MDIKCRIENLSYWSKLIFLRKCLSSSLATKQIQDLSKKTVSKVGAKCRQYPEERQILRMRINEKLRNIADSRMRIDYSNRQTRRLILKDSSLWDQFSNIRKWELGRKWEELRKRREERIRKLFNDFCKKKNIPDTFEGVELGDKNLEDLFGNPDREPAVYGGIEVTNEIKEFLKLPSGF